MKFILLLAVRIYWFAIPASRRRRCLFRESCSMHVYRTATDLGFRSGMSALRTRFKLCRPGYSWHGDGADVRLVARNGVTIGLSELSDAMVEIPRRLLTTIGAASERTPISSPFETRSRT